MNWRELTMKYLLNMYYLPCNFVNRHVKSICNCVKLHASVLVNIMEFTARPHAKFCLARTGKQEINLEWPYYSTPARDL